MLTGAREWWRDAIVYQIYIRSFADADGDGLGDLRGVIDRLDHLGELGVDAIWLTPCYPSPQLDHGYDVADYFDIEPSYGDLATFDRLVALSHARGMKVLMDVVPNHCSGRHAWFQAALGSPTDSRERARYFFRNGRGGTGEEPPNNWRSVFGGPAWTRVIDADGTPGQWYLHTFSPSQPDFDWDCPDVGEMFSAMYRFWFDRGVDGFRVDAVAVVGKAPGLPDAPPTAEGCAENDAWAHNPHTVFWPTAHEAWRLLRKVIDDYERQHPGRVLTSVSEAYTPRRPDLLLQYVRPDEFHQSFSFDLMLSPWHSRMIRQAVADVYEVFTDASAALTWTLNNHDTQRVVTRYGRADAARPESWTGNNLVYTNTPVDIELGTARARAMYLFAAGLPGSMYLFQGEELGLPEVLDIADDRREDPIFARTDGREIGRDGCRIPLPWSNDETTACGFSPLPVEPWLPQPADWGRWSLDSQRENPASMFTLYRDVIARRRSIDQSIALVWIDNNADEFVAYRRGTMVVLMNLSADTIDVPTAIIENHGVITVSSRVNHQDPCTVPSNTCVWLNSHAETVPPRSTVQ
jgi:alpha-glucosidase